MMLSRKSRLLLGSLLIPTVAAQNSGPPGSCIEFPPPGIYNLSQPFLPFLAPVGTRAFDDADTSGAIKYNGNWVATFDAGSVDKTLHVTNDSSASVSFTFNGTGIEWFGVTGPANGLATVCDYRIGWFSSC
jgi:hypothetical protein